MSINFVVNSFSTWPTFSWYALRPELDFFNIFLVCFQIRYKQASSHFSAKLKLFAFEYVNFDISYCVSSPYSKYKCFAHSFNTDFTFLAFNKFLLTKLHFKHIYHHYFFISYSFQLFFKKVSLQFKLKKFLLITRMLLSKSADKLIFS